MFDKNKMYMQFPEEIQVDGLIKVLTDINGNEFNADKYNKGFELIIDYPQEKGKGIRVIDYRVCTDEFERKFWSRIRRRQWVKDPRCSFCGSWVDGWD